MCPIAMDRPTDEASFGTGKWWYGKRTNGLDSLPVRGPELSPDVCVKVKPKTLMGCVVRFPVAPEVDEKALLTWRSL